MNFADSSPPDDDLLGYLPALSRYRRKGPPTILHVDADSVKACQAWQPSTTELRKFWAWLIEKSKQPRVESRMLKQVPKRQGLVTVKKL